jgi:Flp pilus assembly protein TadD
MRFRRILTVALYVLVVTYMTQACTTLGTEDRKQLTLHLENAAQYYDQGHYNRAYQQWGLALQVDPLNGKGRLGQAMALYQLGLEEAPVGISRLELATEELDELRYEDLDGLEWQAELGYALCNDRWVSLYFRKVRQLNYEKEIEGETDEEELEIARAELIRRALIAEKSYLSVHSGEREAQFQLTCLVGLAKMAAFRTDYEASLGYARDYEQQIVRSKRLWRDAVDRYPREAALWDQKLHGAELQEAELRDLIANVLFKLDRIDEAESELNVVIELDPERAGAFLNRGILRQTRKDWDRARQDLRTFLAMTVRTDDDPSVVEARRRLKVVESRVREEDEAAVERLRGGG